MTKIFKLKVKDINLSLLRFLAERDLVGLLKPSPLIESDKGADTVDELYSSEKEYGTHKMICVRKNATEIMLTTHPENEEVIFIDYENRNFKPLYLIIAMDKVDVFEKKAAAGDLQEDDVLAVRLRYNDPLCSIFTVKKDVPHCEVTLSGEGEAPIFYVTEPTDMTMEYANVADYSFIMQE